MVRIRTDLPDTSSRREDAPQWRVPLGSYPDRQCRHPSSAGKARLAVHPPSACSGVKALPNTSHAKAASRQAMLAFRSLDPFRALREPDRRRRDEKRPFPLRTKNSQQNPKQPLDRKSPIQVRIRLAPAVSRVRTWRRHRHSGAAWLDHHYPLALDNVTTRQSGCRATEQDGRTAREREGSAALERSGLAFFGERPGGLLEVLGEIELQGRGLHRNLSLELIHIPAAAADGCAHREWRVLHHFRPTFSTMVQGCIADSSAIDEPHS